LIEALSGQIPRLEITVPFYSEDGRSLPLWDERGGAHGELAQATAAFARYLLELRGFGEAVDASPPRVNNQPSLLFVEVLCRVLR